MSKARKLKPRQIEELEHRHFGRIRYFVLDNIGTIINGLNSRLEIKKIGTTNLSQLKAIKPLIWNLEQNESSIIYLPTA
ncbi:MAG: hypothetical protein GXO48_08745 [Chlorobi bacterium]|nr:hypothetical protein [Chlorobiota bacterium]